MGMLLDYLNLLDRILRDEGWKPSPLQVDHRLRPGFGQIILERDEDCTIIVHPRAFNELPHRKPRPPRVKDQIQEELDKLAEVLGRLRRMYQGKLRLVFQAGPYPLPQDFVDQCRDLGVELVFIREEEDLMPFTEDLETAEALKTHRMF